jgi:DNA-binding NtrC family response regulator
MSICLADNALTSQNTKNRILVVDNERDITITLQAGLEDGGFDVDTFTDPSLALKSFRPNLMILYNIPVPTGSRGISSTGMTTVPAMLKLRPITTAKRTFTACW